MPGIKRKAPDTPRSKSKQPANKRQKTSSSSKERGNPKTKANNKAKGKGNTKGAAPKSSPNFKHFVPPKQREEVQKKTRPFRAPREDRDGSDNDEDVLVEDTEFFAQNRQYLSFLQSADLENGAPYTKQEKKKMKRKEKEQLAKKAEEKKKKSADDDDNGDLEASYMRQFAKEKASRSKKSKEEEEDDEEEQQDGEDDEDNEYGSDGEIDDYEDDDEDDDADDDVDDDEELEVNDEINKKLSKSRLPTFESTTGNVSTDAKYLASTVRDVETVPLSMQIEITKFKRAEKERQLAWLKEKKAQEKEQMVDKKALESKMEKQKIEKLLARLPLVLQSPLDDEHIESAAHYEMQLDLWKQEIARISLEIVSNPEQTIRADIIVESANRAGEDDGDDGSEEEEDFFDKKNRKKEAKGKAHAKGKGKGKGKKRGKDSSQPPMKRPDLMFDANREAAKFLGLVEGHRTDESVRLHWGVFALLKLAEAPEARKPGYKLSHVVSNLAMLSLLQLFKDILPGYKLQPSLLGLPDDPWTKQVSNESTEDEKDLTLAEIQHKKETQKRIDYEHSFLLAFRRYLQQLRFSLLQSKKLHARQERRGIDPNELTFKTKMALVTKQEEISIKCLAELAAVSTTMTWGDRILGLLIPCMGHPNEELSKRCCQSLKEILIADIHGDSTVDAVNLIAHFIRQRKFNLHPRVLDTLLFVKVTEDIKELLKSFKGDESLQMSYRGKKIKIKAEGMSDVFKLKNRERRNMSSHQAKRTREMRTIEKDVQEANAERNNQRVKQMQAQSLHNLFAIYFRILKQCPHSTLTPAVLRGLCRYSHLISLDFQADVLRLLQTLCTSDYAVSYPSPSAAQATSHEDPTGSKKQVKDLSDADYKISTTGHTRNGILFRLQCAITAFEIQKSNANAIETDMKTFYSQAFQDLLIVPVEEWRCWGFDSSQHASSSSVFNTTVRATKKMSITDLSKVNAERLTVELDDIIGAAIEVYKAMILDLRSVPDSRVCAFSKRALELATHTTETGGTLGLLSSMTQTLSRNTSAQAMIDSVPNELTEASSYLPFVAVPDWSHAVSSQMWELPALLRFHYHPAVRTFSNSILRGNYSTPHPPFDLLLRYDTRGGGFNPAVPEPKPHPMVKRMKDDPEAILCPTPNPNFSPFLKEIAARARDVTKSSTPQEAFETYYQTQKTLSYRALLDEVDGRSKAIHKLQEQFQASHPTPAPKTVSKTVSSKRK